jgi:hypothetical protein
MCIDLKDNPHDLSSTRFARQTRVVESKSKGDMSNLHVPICNLLDMNPSETKAYKTVYSISMQAKDDILLHKFSI